MIRCRFCSESGGYRFRVIDETTVPIVGGFVAVCFGHGAKLVRESRTGERLRRSDGSLVHAAR